MDSEIPIEVSAQKRKKIQVELYPDDYRVLRQLLARQRLAEQCRERRRELFKEAQSALVKWAVVGAATAFVGSVVLFGKGLVISLADALRGVGPLP